MFSQEQYEEWKASPITEDLMQEIADQVGNFIGAIMNRRIPDQMDDQYLRGAIQALSAVSGFRPRIVDEKTGEEIDALKGDDKDEA